MVALFAVMSLLSATGQNTKEPSKPQEHVSKPGEVQTGQKKLRVASRAVMKAEQRPVATPINGKTLSMEEALRTSPKGVGGKLQPKVELAQSEKPRMGSGEQKPRMGDERKPAGSHLELVLKVSSEGGAEVVSAKEVPGASASSQSGPGQWVYAVFSGDKPIKAQGIPDPFEMRSFAPPPGSPLEGQGHHIEQAKTALVPVSVPNLTLKSPEISTLSVQLYKVKEGPPLLQVDPSILQKLQQERRLEMKIRIPAATLNRQIMLRQQKSEAPPR